MKKYVLVQNPILFWKLTNSTFLFCWLLGPGDISTPIAKNRKLEDVPIPITELHLCR